jgi:N-acyl-D-amino-acid deacylase
MQRTDSESTVDLLITGGTVIDGLGGPPRRADIAISNGRIASVDGDHVVQSRAKETVDAGGLHIAPGFIDIHTHYDAQVFWDPRCAPSSLYGVTTVFTGTVASRSPLSRGIPTT